MKSFWIVVLVLVIIIGGGFLLLGNDSPDAAVDSEGGVIGLIEDGAESVVEEVEEFVAGENDDVYAVDSGASEIRWSAKRLGSDPHTGSVAISGGRLVRSGDTFQSGQFTIDMTTITEDKDNERFLGHVRSDDFFGVDQFPTAGFVITSVEPVDDDTYTVTGNLTIRDKTNEISFAATLNEQDEQLAFTAAFDIDRTRWDIIFDSSNFFQNLGDRAIRDTIDLELTLVLAESEA